MKNLTHEDVVWWNEVEKDLWVNDDGYVFGIELDLFNNHQNFYLKYPDGIHSFPIYTDDIYDAIDKFNKMVEEIEV